MSDELIQKHFEKLWIDFRARWCDNHDLAGAQAFSHDLAKIVFFHRVVNISVDPAEVDRLIDDAIRLFQEKSFDCVFTLSPLDRPANLSERLVARGFTHGITASAMVYVPPIAPSPVQSAAQVEVSDESDYDIWADVMCRSFDLPRAMGDVGRRVLFVPEVRCYLARVNGVPVGTTLLYSQFGMGYIDLIGTLPEYRHQGVASALLTQAVSDSQSLGNRWTTLEATTGSNVGRLYEKYGFRTAYHRQRYTMCHA